jgi:hypothetical protein
MEIKKLFIATSRIDAPASEVFHWHEQAGALERLTPPWEPVELEQASPGFVMVTEECYASDLGRLGFVGFWSIATISKVDSFATFRFQGLFIVGFTPIPSYQMVRMRVFWKIASNTHSQWATLERFLETGSFGENSNDSSITGTASPKKRCAPAGPLGPNSSPRKNASERLELLLIADHYSKKDKESRKE